jgi:hypothetical protein
VVAFCVNWIKVSPYNLLVVFSKSAALIWTSKTIENSKKTEQQQDYFCLDLPTLMRLHLHLYTSALSCLQHAAHNLESMEMFHKIFHRVILFYRVIELENGESIDQPLHSFLQSKSESSLIALVVEKRYS